MNITVDRQSLLGLLSATGLPLVFHAIIAFLHPSLYTLACGIVYADGLAACYADDKVEAILWLALSALAVAYGAFTFWQHSMWNPSPPKGAHNAIIPNDQVPVTIDKNGGGALQSAKANPGTVADATPITPIVVPQPPPSSPQGVSP
jgi:hypothetical protein